MIKETDQKTAIIPLLVAIEWCRLLSGCAYAAVSQIAIPFDVVKSIAEVLLLLLLMLLTQQEN